MMNRRNFIRNTSLTAAALPTIIVAACDPKKNTDNQKKTTENATVEEFKLNEISVSDLQQKMSSGELTAKAIAEMYLKRIDSIDKNGPKLNSVIEVNPDAIAQAEALDKERKDGKVRGPLHGIPILIKDNIDTADKMMTTAGSLALEGNHAAKDAFIVTRLREAGAIILGKTNLSEFANFRSTRSSSGWSSRGGQTKNPYVLDRNPCGSSSGSGAAVSANLCAIAIGTETNGSIACPSSINGVVGIKPTVGLVSRSGIIPISFTQDTAGPMARTVTDAALLLDVMAGVDANDPKTTQPERKSFPDYTQFLNPDGLKGKRIGIEKSFLKVHEGVDMLFQKAIGVLKESGATIVEVDFLKTVEGISGAEFTVLQYEFKDGLNKYLAGSKINVKNLKDIIDFNKKNEVKVMPFFKQEILETSEEKKSLDTAEYKDALKKITTTARKSIDDMLKKDNLDALCGPTNGPSWCTDLINGDFYTGYGMYSPAAIAGYPHISIPMGLVGGLPVGLTFLGSAYQEPQLISIGFAYERGSKSRSVPQFQKSLSV
jgi:amidase